ncbi:putative serine protease PepD [Knoellia remsis]|uniref:Putative serine protease PepD n=1 Tax=Knoellia remsis TaxID=407159 RepID=A0A2T0TTY1_9MICO|nr:trypsin-like peptidase domain-containing protein [Knoellia remsis]PRY49111.1 putative serine protease PepD [Knoellia remsis]
MSHTESGHPASRPDAPADVPAGGAPTQTLPHQSAQPRPPHDGQPHGGQPHGGQPHPPQSGAAHPTHGGQPHGQQPPAYSAGDTQRYLNAQPDTARPQPAPTTWYGANEPAGPAFPPPPAPGAAPHEPAPQPTPRRRRGELVAVAALAAVLASGGTFAAAQLTQDTQTSSTASPSSELGRGTQSAPVSQADPQNPNWTATAAAVSPSVVAIKTDSGEGSGVVIDSSGNVITNNHVVAGAQQLTVTLSDGRTFKARIRGTDPSTDLAVLSIEAAPKDLKPIAIGDSEALKVGDPVMAVGNPLGLAGTVTTGIVSALNRPVTTQAAQGQPQQQPQNPFGNPYGEGQQGPQNQEQGEGNQPVVTNAIQTSAAINPGNSGGALVNANGQLIGINSSIASLGSSGGSSGNIGIGFAIPIKEAARIAKELIADGKAEHAYLGVSVLDGTASDGSATRAGAKLQSVSPNTPAAKAGLKTGDVVTAVNDESVDSSESLVAHIREYAVGDKVTVTLLRDGKSQDVAVTLEAAPSN